MYVKKSIDEKLELLSKSADLFYNKMQALAKTILTRDLNQEERKTADLAQLMGETMALADILGRRRALLEVDALAKRKQPARFRISELSVARFGKTPIFPSIPFAEAYDDLVSRDARLVKNADDVRRVYSTEHGFALLKLPRRLSDQTRLTLTRKIQEMLAGYVGEGKEKKTIREQLADVGHFSKAYAETVYRTNLATAFTAGRMKQLEDPEVKEITPAFEFTSMRDSDVRPGHRAADGFVAGTDHKEWNRIAPPLSWNCRCDLRLVDRKELADRGLLTKGGHVKPWYPPNFANARPDRGFGHRRPDFTVYG